MKPDPKEIAKYYTYMIEWVPEDHVFYAQVEEWETIQGYGQSPTQALLEILVAVADKVADCIEKGEDYPIPYRMPPPSSYYN